MFYTFLVLVCQFLKSFHTMFLQLYIEIIYLAKFLSHACTMNKYGNLVYVQTYVFQSSEND
jgi:hypothetical protein